VRRLFISGGAFSLMIVQAIAADVAPYYRAPLVQPIWAWTGFYIGANAGWVDSVGQTITNTGTDTGAGGLGAGLNTFGAIPLTVNVNNRGFIGGGQVGYNWQIGPNWVWGLEGDLAGVGAKSSTAAGSATAVPITTIYTSELDMLGTVRARLGFLAIPNLLLYGTGGLAYGETKLGSAAVCPTSNPPCQTEPTTANQSSNWSFGWTVGAGVEWKFAPDWSVKAEYLYVDLGPQSNTITYNHGLAPAAFTSSLTSTVNLHDNIVRFGVNYNFGGY
jgi:outer membrane immunogenic protein